MTPNDRIKKEAQTATDVEEKRLKDNNHPDYGRMVSQLHGYHFGYIAGATAEHDRANEELKRANDAAIMFCNRYNVVAEQLAETVDRAKVLVDALEFVKNNGLCSETTEVINKALEQWEGKEGGDE
jgi:hypothetical protein